MALDQIYILEVRNLSTIDLHGNKERFTLGPIVSYFITPAKIYAKFSNTLFRNKKFDLGIIHQKIKKLIELKYSVLIENGNR